MTISSAATRNWHFAPEYEAYTSHPYFTRREADADPARPWVILLLDCGGGEPGDPHTILGYAESAEVAMAFAERHARGVLQ